MRWVLTDIAIELHRIANAVEKLVPRRAISATLIFRNLRGDKMLTVHLNDKPGTAHYQEFDGPNGTGSKIAPSGTVSYSSDTSAVATVDASTGQLTYLSAGTATISASDGGNLPASDVLTVEPSVAVSATMTLQPGV